MNLIATNTQLPDWLHLICHHSHKLHAVLPYIDRSGLTVHHSPACGSSVPSCWQADLAEIAALLVQGRVNYTGQVGPCKHGIGKVVCDAVKDGGRRAPRSFCSACIQPRKGHLLEVSALLFAATAACPRCLCYPNPIQRPAPGHPRSLTRPVGVS